MQISLANASIRDIQTEEERKERRRSLSSGGFRYLSSLILSLLALETYDSAHHTAHQLSLTQRFSNLSLRLW